MKRNHFSETYTLSEVGKKLSIGRNDLSELLKEKNIFQYKPMPYLQFLDRGLFIRKVKEHNGRVDQYTLVTYKGLVWLRKLLEKLRSIVKGY